MQIGIVAGGGFHASCSVQIPPSDARSCCWDGMGWDVTALGALIRTLYRPAGVPPIFGELVKLQERRLGRLLSAPHVNWVQVGNTLVMLRVLGVRDATQINVFHACASSAPLRRGIVARATAMFQAS